ncbi:hypothetical protein HHI36_000089 [Cryptolaemus montrouzieri]|uniref:Peptidase S1 domain-containing protein n=1 Tax=Cryptolaemus montrouzieri TaxID=559131 RepID=A0ABD2P3J9_9CUCU
MMVSVILSFVSFCFLSCALEGVTGICPDNFECIPSSKCIRNDEQDELIYFCNPDYPGAICCPKVILSKIKHPHNEDIDSDKIIFKHPLHELLPFNANDKKKNHSNKKETDTEDTEHRNSDKNTSRPPIMENFDDIRLNLPDFSTEDNLISRTNFTTNENKFDRISNKSSEKDSVENQFIVRRRKPFEEKCGLATAVNKITGGDVAELGQFPWMALLGFKQAAVPSTQYLCGGSLITKSHVLTAAHCILKNRPLELYSVRFGEFNLSSPNDCMEFGKDKVCADKHVDIPVESVMIHPEYNVKTLKNDIAIIKIRHPVRETAYIRTVCLPFDRDMSNVNLTGQRFIISGWGKSNSANLFGSNVLKFARVTTWDPQKCNMSIPPEVQPLSSTQLCANGPNTEDACKGDSGGPLINITIDAHSEVRNIQYGIVSFGTATCGDHNLPTIYTRVDKYLQWILENVT